MLVANAVVDPDQPRLQVGENQMDDRQVLLGNSEVLIAALTEASIAAPIVSNDQRSRRDGALDEPTERLGATGPIQEKWRRPTPFALLLPRI